MTSSLDLASFAHRTTYGEVTGRDAWTVRRVGAWVSEIMPRLAASAGSGAVLDVGCAEQPFRPLIETSGRRYVGMDVVQNRTRSVDVIGTLEDAPAPAVAFPLILCTEVLEHVSDIDAAFAGLRRLAATGGLVAITVPFIFPLHMEPYDFRRLTLHGIARLAGAHRFTIEEEARLGSATDVLATLVADLSILPTSRSFAARVRVAVLRSFVAAAVRLLDSPALTRGVAVNSNTYSTNAVVLRAV